MYSHDGDHRLDLEHISRNELTPKELTHSSPEAFRREPESPSALLLQEILHPVREEMSFKTPPGPADSRVEDDSLPSNHGRGLRES